MRYKRVEKSKCMRSLCEELTSCPTYCSDRCSWLSPVEDENAELKKSLEIYAEFLKKTEAGVQILRRSNNG